MSDQWRKVLLVFAVLGAAACSDSPRTANTTGSTDGTGTLDAVDVTDAVDTTDMSDGATQADTTGLSDSTDMVDADAATDLTDGMSGMEATDGIDASDGVDTTDGAETADGADITDGQDGVDNLDSGVDAVDMASGVDGQDMADGFDGVADHDGDDDGGDIEGFMTDGGCWVPADTSGISCDPLCEALAECNPICGPTCENIYANFASADLANDIIQCASGFTCESEGGGLDCIFQNAAPNEPPSACSTITDFLNGCQAPIADPFSQWCTMVGPYLKPGVFTPMFDCFQQGCVTSSDCILNASCLFGTMYQLADPGNGGGGEPQPQP